MHIVHFATRSTSNAESADNADFGTAAAIHMSRCRTRRGRSTAMRVGFCIKGERGSEMNKRKECLKAPLKVTNPGRVFVCERRASGTSRGHEFWTLSGSALARMIGWCRICNRRLPEQGRTGAREHSAGAKTDVKAPRIRASVGPVFSSEGRDDILPGA